MFTPTIHRARKFHQMTVETTKMLLAAGSNQDIAESKRSVKSGLTLLIGAMIFRNPVNELLIYEPACSHRNQYKLRAELIQILVKNETCEMEHFILKAAIDIVTVRERGRITNIPGNIDLYDEMVDSLGDILHSFVFAGADQVTYKLQDIMNHYEKTFVNDFIIIAGYSFQPGRSKKLVRSILSALNANIVNRLRRKIYELQQVMRITTPDKLRTFTNAALKCVKEIETPFSLQALSRSAIIHAMSTGSLNIESLASKRMPVHLKMYVLHRE